MLDFSQAPGAVVMTPKRRQGAALDPDCIERLAVISTGHVSKATAAVLDAGGEELPMSCYRLEYGWLVVSATSPEHEPEVPSELLKVMQLAKRHGCTWIRFDCDGPFIDGLDRFDW